MTKTANQGPARQQERNMFVLAVFTVFWCGFIMAMFLGAVSKISHDWVSVIISASAAIISAYAVYLVNGTLQATRDMAINQKYIGDLQTRAWVSYDVSKINFYHNCLYLEVIPAIRNFGPTPARDIRFRCQAFRLLLPNTLLSEDAVDVELIDLPPNKAITSTTGIVELFNDCTIIIKVEWEYKTISDDYAESSVFLVLKEIDGKTEAHPLTKSDFFDLDEKYNCHSKQIIQDFLKSELVDLNSQFES
ncbi:MAG: hypothetical protein ABGX10_03995 [Paracoccus sp. (in: a-proteobacteria)]|uniref:hypothetical protein n=1 Tax=Paracoccus sp. TaxID=267 RepID=UPI003241D54B